MFYYLNGTVALLRPYLAVIDCGGVGYACATTQNTLSQLKEGEQAKLYTYLNVREDVFDLYGFYTQEELNTFKMLLSISGVGPKAALSILSHSTPEKLAVAILSGDEKALTVAPGIGKKIAQRIILELKDKMAGAQEGLPVTAVAAGKQISSKVTEAAAALQVLGYTQGDISAALKGLDVENLSLEEIVRQALKGMVKEYGKI